MSGFLRHASTRDAPTAGFLSQLLDPALSGPSHLLSQLLSKSVARLPRGEMSDPHGSLPLSDVRPFLHKLALKGVDRGQLRYPLFRLPPRTSKWLSGVQAWPIENYHLRYAFRPRAEDRFVTPLSNQARPHILSAPKNNGPYVHPIPRAVVDVADKGRHHPSFRLIPVSAPAKRHHPFQNETLGPQVRKIGSDESKRPSSFPIAGGDKVTKHNHAGSFDGADQHLHESGADHPWPSSRKDDAYGRSGSRPGDKTPAYAPPAGEEHHFSLATELAQAGLGRWGGLPGRLILGGIHGFLSVPTETLGEFLAWLADFVEPGAFARVRAEVEDAERKYQEEVGDSLAADIGDLVGGLVLLTLTLAPLIELASTLAVMVAGGGLGAFILLQGLEGLIFSLEQYAGNSSVPLGVQIGINTLMGVIALPLLTRIAKIARKIGPKILGPTFIEIIDRALAKVRAWTAPEGGGAAVESGAGRSTDEAVDRAADRAGRPADNAVGGATDDAADRLFDRPAARIAEQLPPGLLDPAVLEAIERMAANAKPLRVGDPEAAKAEALARIAARSTGAPPLKAIGPFVEKGLYMFPDAKNGGWYIGQSQHITERLKVYIAQGRYIPGSEIRIEVPGGVFNNNIAEHIFIQEMTGGQMAKTSSRVSNKNDPIGRFWRNILGIEHPRR